MNKDLMHRAFHAREHLTEAQREAVRGRPQDMLTGAFPVNTVQRFSVFCRRFTIRDKDADIENFRMYNPASVVSWSALICTILTHRIGPMETHWPLWREYIRRSNRHETYAIDSAVYAELESLDGWAQVNEIAQLHLSQTGEGGDDGSKQVAYYRNAADLVADRATRTTLGRFLRRNFDTITDAQVQRIDAVFRACYSPPLQIATSPEDIMKVYSNGPSSCMSGAPAVRAYGDSDLAVAYLGTLDKVRARAVIWPERKRYVRIYGDEALRHVLVAAGYQHNTDIVGARLRLVQLEDNTSDRRMAHLPYIDADVRAVPSEDEAYLNLVCASSDEGVHARTTCGYITLGYRCSCCGISMESLQRVEGDIRPVCAACLTDQGFLWAISSVRSDGSARDHSWYRSRDLWYSRSRDVHVHRAISPRNLRLVLGEDGEDFPEARAMTVLQPGSNPLEVDTHNYNVWQCTSSGYDYWATNGDASGVAQEHGVRTLNQIAPTTGDRDQLAWLIESVVAVRRRVDPYLRRLRAGWRRAADQYIQTLPSTQETVPAQAEAA